jgi:hypothetical protein
MWLVFVSWNVHRIKKGSSQSSETGGKQPAVLWTWHCGSKTNFASYKLPDRPVEKLVARTEQEAPRPHSSTLKIKNSGRWPPVWLSKRCFFLLRIFILMCSFTSNKILGRMGWVRETLRITILDFWTQWVITTPSAAPKTNPEVAAEHKCPGGIRTGVYCSCVPWISLPLGSDYSFGNVSPGHCYWKWRAFFERLRVLQSQQTVQKVPEWQG